MPDRLEPDGDPLIEAAYLRAWGKVGGAGRLRRSFSRHDDIRRMVAFQIRSRNPDLAESEVRRRTAERMYLLNDAARGWLGRSSAGGVDEGLPKRSRGSPAYCNG